jgi:hypothetical protein
MSARVPIEEIVEGLELQSDEMHSYLHRPTGRVVFVSDDALAAADDGDEELVSDEELATARAILAAEDEYLALPDRFEIDEYRMMERFGESLTDGRDVVLTALRGRGAFRYFKDTVHRLGLANKWYAYRDECYTAIAREWCAANGVEFGDSVRADA